MIIFSIIVYSINFFSSKSNLNQIVISNQNQIQNKIIKNTQKIQDIQLEEVIEWKIIIEKINIEANISEGVEESVLKQYVGHYKNTNIFYGNIVLKAYNTGENKNYFANLKELEIDDEIKYIVNDKEKIYKVISNKIIDNEEKYINTNYVDNSITLITYIKDLPEKRRCVIAYQK